MACPSSFMRLKAFKGKPQVIRCGLMDAAENQCFMTDGLQVLIGKNMSSRCMPGGMPLLAACTLQIRIRVKRSWAGVVQGGS
jgi:hypothetical protein